ncbi:MAG: Ig-like domain-containing protein [Propionibacteriales bacterium]|nr:Ig-like domain-containing protein [Propionibacteriales bacterium]
MKSLRVPVGVVVGAVVAAGLVIGTAPAQAATKVVTANLVDQSETRATGHNVFAGGKVRVYTEGATSTDKAAGYFDVNRTLNAVAAVEPTMSWDPNIGPNLTRPGLQLKVDFNADGNIDGILVGEPTYADGTALYGNDWWASNGSKQFVKDGAPSHTGGFGSDNHGTLAQWKANFPAARVIQGGWSLGSGAKGDGFINNFVIAGDTYTFAAAPALTSAVLSQADVNTTETRAQGTNTFLPTGGIEIQTVLAPNPSLAKSAGYFSTGGLPLSQAGEPSLDYSNYAGALLPSTQLVVDFDNDGTADGILVGEPKYANGTVLYGTDWWLSNGSSVFVKADAPQHGGGFGSDNHGQLSEWRGVFPNAKVLAAGWSLGSGVEGHGVINAITVGSTRYTFVGTPPNVAPTAAPVSATTAFGTAKTVTLAGADADGDPLVYTVGTTPNGTVSLAGDQATFTPAYGFSGTASFGYTVKDAGHAAVASSVTITVGAPPVDDGFVVTVTKGGTATKPTVTLSGKTNAPLPVSGSIQVLENGVKLKGSSVIGRSFYIPLGTETVGTHVYVITYAGKSATVVVQVP